MLTFAGFYGLMALGLNLVWGMAGMINLGLVGFFAFGAYVSALATVNMGAPIPAGVAAASALTAGAGVVMALTTRNLRGDYLAIVTLGFSEVVRLVASNEIWLTKGTDGISGIPGPWRGRVTPEAFNLIYLAVLALTAGGTGDNRGAVVGALLLVFFMESTRFATGWLPGLRPVQVAAVREFLIGASLVVVLRWRPGGLIPERIPRA